MKRRAFPSNALVGTTAWMRDYHAWSREVWPRRNVPWTRKEERALSPLVGATYGLYSMDAAARIRVIAGKLGRTIHGVLARVALLREVARRCKHPRT